MIKHLQSHFQFLFREVRLSLVVLLFATLTGNAQTVFWSDNFDTPAGGAENNNAGAGWNIVKGGGSNQWYINNGSLCGTGNRLHVGYSGNPTASTYASFNASESHAYSPAISTIGATGLNVTFIWKSRGLANQAYGEFGYSTDNGSTWTWLATKYQSTSGCTNASIPLPVSAENISGLKLGFHWTNNQNLFSGQDPPFDVDNIKITCVTCPSSSGNTITTGTVTGSPFCAGASISVPFTSTGTFNSGNVFTAQLSDASGSFASPVTLGTGTSPISGIIPGGTATGSGYRVRVVSSNPVTTGTDNGVNITINSAVTASVSVSASSTTICQGSSVTFSATPANGGAAPTYQWKVNGTNAGSGGATFTTTSLNNNDNITVVMTSNANCVTGSPATSNKIVMSVTPSANAFVSISASTTSICPGGSVTFSATPVNGGTTPTYQWKVNGTNVGSGGATFTTTSLNNNDNITVVMTSNANCVTGSPATSSGINITVSSNLPASVSISADNASVCAGTMINFSAAPTNGGSTPSYQWKVNGNDTGANNPVFSATLNNNDVVSCIMTSNASCATGSPAASNPVTVTVTPLSAASVTISSSSASICPGEAVDFSATATGSGSTPAYQWMINSKNTGDNSNTFNSSLLNNNDTVVCVMTSSDACVTGSPASSNKVIISMGNNASAGIVSAGRDTICDGTPAILDVSGSNGNLQWQSSTAKNSGFSDISGQTNVSFIAFPSSDKYYRVYSVSGSCSDTSAAYKINVKPSPEASFTYSQTGSNGRQITFDSDESHDATDFEWTFGDGTTDFSPNPSHTYAKDTIYHVCLTVYNGSNCSFTICKDIQTGATGITVTAHPELSWKVYPQPFTGFIILQNENNNSIERVEIYDLLGRVLFSNSYNNQRTNSLRIDLPGLTTGMYLLKIKSPKSVDVLEILKK